MNVFLRMKYQPWRPIHDFGDLGLAIAAGKRLSVSDKNTILNNSEAPLHVYPPPGTSFGR